jgi:hypothetical protein
MVKLEVFSGDPPCPGCVAMWERCALNAKRSD